MRRSCLVLGLCASALVSVAAQTRPAVRQLGPIERVSTESLASVATALQMPGGHVLVNDIRARRLLLFDSTLAHPRIIADTTSATANAYGQFPGTLIRYRSDSALFIDPSSASMFVIDPTGKTARILAMPQPDNSPGLVGGPFGMPGVDARGRLAYFVGELPGAIQLISRGSKVTLASGKLPDDFTMRFDSAFVARADLVTRVVDTVASIKTPKYAITAKVDAEGLLQEIATTPDPLPLVDDWAMLSDGTIAVVRGRDYRIDWLDTSGHWTSSPKMSFDWQKVSDERKQTLIDSAAAALQARFDEVTRASAIGGGRSGGRGRGGPPGSPAGGTESRGLVPNVVKRPTLDDLPAYVPPIQRGALHPDAAGNVWIRTSTTVQGQPVYDVATRRGEIIDRVQLPPFRTIAGFGPNVIYLAVKDSAGVVHLERARVK